MWQGFLQEVLREMTEENGGAEFWIALPPRRVREMAHRHMLDRGFSIGADLTEATVEYSVVRQRKFPLGLLAISPDFYRVRLSIREEGNARTRLTLMTTYKGRWEGVGQEIERWIIEELGGEPAGGG
jgi:hypothetical protein